MKKQDNMRKRRHNDKQQAWEVCSRRSMEIISSANGWLKSECVGLMNESAFFCHGILH